MECAADTLPLTRFEEALGIWDGREFVLMLKDLGIPPQSLSVIMVRYMYVHVISAFYFSYFLTLLLFPQHP